MTIEHLVLDGPQHGEGHVLKLARDGDWPPERPQLTLTVSVLDFTFLILDQEVFFAKVVGKHAVFDFQNLVLATVEVEVHRLLTDK